MILTGFKSFNHGSVRRQEDTIRQLADNDNVPFTWILPGHGRMIRFASLEEKEETILAAADYFHDEEETIGSYGLHSMS